MMLDTISADNIFSHIDKCLYLYEDFPLKKWLSGSAHSKVFSHLTHLLLNYFVLFEQKCQILQSCPSRNEIE